MDLLLKFWLTASVYLALAMDTALGFTIVSGTVFCDQCKDGEISIFDFPLHGIKVQMICVGGDGESQIVREQMTNWLGGYALRFDGAPDLSSCYVVTVASGGVSDCGAVAGPPKPVRLVFDIFGFEMYIVDPLLSQPAEPVAFCPRFGAPVPVSPVEPPPVYQLPPSVPPLPPFPPIPQFPPFPPLPQFPPFPGSPPVSELPPFPPVFPQFPPLPQLPPFPGSPPVRELPPFPPVFPQFPPFTGSPPFPPVFSQFPPLPQFPPFPGSPPVNWWYSRPPVEASACPYQKWLEPESRCYWRVVTPDTKVAAVFGLAAASKYGTELTLVQAMLGRDDPYRTLLREGTTALLNSYHSIVFPYQPSRVIQEINSALLIGSTQQALHTAITFLRANSGQTTHSTCSFGHCT